MTIRPILHKIKEQRLLILGYQKVGNKEYGQITYADRNNLNKIKSRTLPWEEAESLFKFLENKINKTLETR